MLFSAPAPPPARLLLVYKNLAADRAVGSHVGLGITAMNAARVLQAAGHSVELTPAFDGFELRDSILPRRSVTHCLLLAPWFDTPFLQALIRQFPWINFCVAYHSNVGFLQADRYAVKLLKEQLAVQLSNHNFAVAANCSRLADAIRLTLGRSVALLPNLYALPASPVPAARYHPGDLLRLGVFGAVRPQKNMLTACWAAAQIAKRLNVRAQISINAGRVEGGESVLGSIRELLAGLAGVELVESPWLDWPAFRGLVRSQHLLLSPSYTESFCAVTADGVAEGVPSVVSSAIDWAPASWRADVDDASAIAATGLRLLQASGAAMDGYRALTKHNAAGLQSWNGWLA